MKKIACFTFLFCCFTSSTFANPQIDFFEKNIRPVLSQQCYSCHSSKSKDIKGGLALDTKDGLLKGGDSGPAIIPGQPEKSLIIDAMSHQSMEMPPSSKLPDNIIQNFIYWIKIGAPDPRIKTTNKKLELAQAKKLWSFRPVANVSSDIDTLIETELKKQNLVKVNEADEYSLLRRVYFDLLGIPPSVNEVLSYINNTEENKYEKLIDTLLNRKEFGENWGRHWLDIARYADSTGKDQNITFPYAWRYKEYVINSLNKDKAYDIFIKEQLVGDLLDNKTPEEYNEQLAATGFLAIGTKNLTANPKQYVADLIDEQIDVVSRGFLGITLSCARCHDHKFDAISQKDYYGIYAVLQNTKTLDGVNRGNNIVGYEGEYGYLINNATKDLFEDKKYEEWLLLCDAKNISNKIRSLRTFNNNPNENDKKQIEKEVEKYEKQLEEKIKKITELNLYNHYLKMIMTTDNVMCMQDNFVSDKTKLQIRGDVNSLGEEVNRSIPEIFSSNNKKHQPKLSKLSGRLELAEWISDKKNPLTYRVHTNRIWKILFGKGLVDSYDNFGILAGEPSNIRLLDHITDKFIDNKFSNKYIIKYIMMSRAYKSSTDYNSTNYEKDSDNIYLWRMNEKRLTSEQIRDSLLFLSDSIDQNNNPYTLLLNTYNRRISGKVTTHINKSKQRSIYLPTPRDFDIEFLDIFDRPDNNLLSANRNITTVPTQALFLMNNNDILDHCNNEAQFLTSSDVSIDKKIDRIFLKYLTRPAKEIEVNILKSLIKDEKDQAGFSLVVQVIISTAEFRNIK